MKVLLTSCGLETKTIEKSFMDLLPNAPSETKTMFIPTAANSPDAIEVLPECLNDLIKCGIKRENITVYDLHEELDDNICNNFDVIYLCGGSPDYLLKRINENKFRNQLSKFISSEGIVVGVSAGSMIFANNMPNNLGLLKCALDVHCNDEVCEKAGIYDINRNERIKLGNRQAISFTRNNIIIFE